MELWVLHYCSASTIANPNEACNALARVQRVHKSYIFGTSPFAPTDFETFSTIKNRGF